VYGIHETDGVLLHQNGHFAVAQVCSYLFQNRDSSAIAPFHFQVRVHQGSFGGVASDTTCLLMSLTNPMCNTVGASS
jgi:hypothetical protein